MDIVISLFPFLLYFFPFFSLLLVTFIPFSSHTGRLSLSQLYMLIVSILNPRSYRILPYTLVVQSIDPILEGCIHQYLPPYSTCSLPFLQYLFLPSIDYRFPFFSLSHSMLFQLSSFIQTGSKPFDQ